MKRRFSSFIGMILVCAVTIAQTSISLLPKPQLYKDTGKNFTMGKVKLSTPVLRPEWEVFIMNAGGEIVEHSSSVIEVELVPSIEEARLNGAEAYRLSVSNKRIKIEAVTEQGVYWAMQTLRQLERKKGKRSSVAGCEIVDWPAFRIRGYASNLTQARCKLAARNFIARHSNANASNYEKFRSCFYYIMAYTNFVGYMDPTPQEFKTKDWVYKYSLQMFQNGLTGNCYGIASSVAAIAKELGYEPYVITIPDGHSFVMINGLYYDNMYGTLFGAATRPAYTIEHKIKF